MAAEWEGRYGGPKQIDPITSGWHYLGSLDAYEQVLGESLL